MRQPRAPTQGVIGPYVEERSLMASMQDPTSILGPTGKIARRLPAYEHRTEQLEMARAVARAIEQPGHLVVEAGTGVGKSFAYLVPSILAAVHQKKKVVISTHTIALQEQLLSKDIPFLQSVMEEEFTAVLVKGRSNYISLRRLNVAIQRQDSLFQQVEESDQLATVRMWSKKTTDGSRADLSFRPFPSVWEAVQSEDGNCLGRECPNHKECFFYRARRRVQHANILIVNHALFVTDLALREAGDFGILPKYDVAILDEAHTFESVAGQHLGLQISSLGVDLRLARLYNERSGKGLLAIQEARCRDQSTEADSRRGRRFLRPGRRLVSPPTVEFQWPGAEPSENTRDIAGGAATGWPRPSRRVRRNLSARKSASSWTRPNCAVALSANEISAWLDQGESDNVYWVELENKSRTRIKLASAPLDVGPKLAQRACSTESPTCVLTSATMCVGSPPKFDFIKTRLGLTCAETLALGSPFDYARQVTVHVPRNLPDPADQPEAFERGAIRAIAHYLEQSNGKAFVLFTSYKMLDAAARALDAVAGATQHRIICPERRHASLENGRSVQGRH